MGLELKTVDPVEVSFALPPPPPPQKKKLAFDCEMSRPYKQPYKDSGKWSGCLVVPLIRYAVLKNSQRVEPRQTQWLHRKAIEPLLGCR